MRDGDSTQERGLVVGGREYAVDCIIFASGFEVGGDMARKNGFEIIGRDGLTLSSAWRDGPRSKHGTHVHGFPNLFFQGCAASHCSRLCAAATWPPRHGC